MLVLNGLYDILLNNSLIRIEGIKTIWGGIMMAGEIKITPTQLRTDAHAYSKGSETVHGVLQSLDSLNSQLEAEWSGAAFEQYMNQYTELKPKVQDFIQLLSDINGQLQNAASTLEDTDIQLSKGFGLN